MTCSLSGVGQLELHVRGLAGQRGGDDVVPPRAGPQRAAVAPVVVGPATRPGDVDHGRVLAVEHDVLGGDRARALAARPDVVAAGGDLEGEACAARPSRCRRRPRWCAARGRSSRRRRPRRRRRPASPRRPRRRTARWGWAAARACPSACGRTGRPPGRRGHAAGGRRRGPRRSGRPQRGPPHRRRRGRDRRRPRPGGRRRRPAAAPSRAPSPGDASRRARASSPWSATSCANASEAPRVSRVATPGGGHTTRVSRPRQHRPAVAPTPAPPPAAPAAPPRGTARRARPARCSAARRTSRAPRSRRPRG